MVYKELKMKFNALFVCSYSLIHADFIGTCCLYTIKMHLKQIGKRYCFLNICCFILWRNTSGSMEFIFNKKCPFKAFMCKLIP